MGEVRGRQAAASDGLHIHVEEKVPEAVALLGGFYFLDALGVPFRRAEGREIGDLVLVTGIERFQYADMPKVVEAAFRRALDLLALYRSRPRPRLSEIHIQPNMGFRLVLKQGVEVRLGQDNLAKKLTRLDQILEAVQAPRFMARGPVRTVMLDGKSVRRVPVRFAASLQEGHRRKTRWQEEVPTSSWG